MDAQMADVKAAAQHNESHPDRHHSHLAPEDEHMDEGEVDIGQDQQQPPQDQQQQHQGDAGAAEQDGQQYDQQYAEGYAQQYHAQEEGVEGDVTMYEEQTAEYDQGDPNAVYDTNAADAAAAVASAVAAVASHSGRDQPHQQGEYDDQQPQDDGAQEYAEQHEGDGQEYTDQHDGYVDDPNAHQYEQGEEQGEMDEQTLASHPATSREMEVAESMVVDSEHNIASDVSQAVGRFARYSDPDGLQTLAATSSAVTPHGAHAMETPTKMHHHRDSLGTPYSNQKQMMPKFNRARNWTIDETKILLAELERIVNSSPDERRENVLRAHSTFDEIGEVLREKGYNHREGQGCMIRWRNLLRVYKHQRAQIAEGNPPSNPGNMQYAPAIESIYRFPPDGLQYSLHAEASPGMDTSQIGSARGWSQANGYETPARKRAREMNVISENIDQLDNKLEQALDHISQQSDLLRSLEDRLSRTEDALRQSEAVIAELNHTIGEKDAKREELQAQLMVTVQALSQVISTKKAEAEAEEEEEQPQPQPQEGQEQVDV
ncbi:hypothetical protein GGF46_000057 [Coemansia sp. RSA 552]|nr:hypothetical protein GGF46_000057 [Coemansia sp. RSA 552]